MKPDFCFVAIGIFLGNFHSATSSILMKFSRNTQMHDAIGPNNFKRVAFFSTRG